MGLLKAATWHDLHQHLFKLFAFLHIFAVHHVLLHLGPLAACGARAALSRVALEIPYESTHKCCIHKCWRVPIAQIVLFWLTNVALSWPSSTALSSWGTWHYCTWQLILFLRSTWVRTTWTTMQIVWKPRLACCTVTEGNERVHVNV